MQQHRNTTKRSAGQAFVSFLAVFMTLLLTVGSALLLPSSSSASQLSTTHRSTEPSGSGSETSPTPGAGNTGFPWDADTGITAPSSNTFQLSQQMATSPLFANAYLGQSGEGSLGPAVTPAFQTGEGWIQFYASGALLLPGMQVKHTLDPGELQDPLAALMRAGTREPGSGVLRLPLLQALLAAGSQVPLVDGSSLTYVDLRAAANSSSMVMAPQDGHLATLWQTGGLGVFVAGGTRDGKNVGHLVPLPIWSYIQRPNISPDGWETDFGVPITEALPINVNLNGTMHHLLIQAFWNDAVVFDQDQVGPSSGQPAVSFLDMGVAYLLTIGPPPAWVVSQQAVWALADTALLGGPGTGSALAHIGQGFPLVLQGDSSWAGGMLWYRVQWTTPHHTFSAWAQATALTFTSPGNAPVWSSIDALSPELAAYLATQGDNVGVAIYDLTRQRYYTSNANDQFITGSSVKVPIMLTLLDLTESQGREPNSDEMALLTTMIENSNNDSAAALYYGEVGGAAGVRSYMQSIGISGLNLDPDAFGWSTITPLAMVTLLTRLQQGAILTAQDRELALTLMENIEPDQQVGVGDTAPPEATVAMKDGWVPGPDGLWTMNSSGIVMMGQETYFIAVYSQDQPTLEAAQALVQSVCGAIASLLL